MALQHREGLITSPTATATRLLALFFVARALVKHADLARTNANVQVVLPRYLAGLSRRAGDGFCFASLASLALLASLARYWNGSLLALQLGARLVFQWAVAAMSADRIHQVVLYGASHLLTSGAAAAAATGGGSAASSPGGTVTMARATIVLGVMECERPGLLPIGITKEVALSLTLLMADQGGASVGAQGESAGASGGPHVHGAAVVRTLVALGVQLPLLAAAVQDHHHGHGHHHTNSSVSAHPGTAVDAMSRQALLAVATHNLRMVVQTVTTDLEHGQPLTNQSILAALSAVAFGNAGSLAGLSAVTAGSGTASHAASGLLLPSSAAGAAGTGAAAGVVAVDKATMLRLVSCLVHKLAAARATSGSAPRLAEAVVAVLDPAHAVQRDVPLQPATATATLFEMVRRYPVVAFHAAAQRLATGGTDGRVVRSPPSGLMYLVGAVAGSNSLKAFAYTRPSRAAAASGWMMVQLAVSKHAIELAEGGNRVQFQI
ncbi:hypothetical protein H9P43_005251 [Blastocladiella emersonii ATCC 22665]|nr:hypothetical protein H9P43_005251 [Blastocladiella emersonii ATCC 22665]